MILSFKLHGMRRHIESSGLHYHILNNDVLSFLIYMCWFCKINLWFQEHAFYFFGIKQGCYIKFWGEALKSYQLYVGKYVLTYIASFLHTCLVAGTRHQLREHTRLELDTRSTLSENDCQVGRVFYLLPMIKRKLLWSGKGNVIQALAPEVDKENKIFLFVCFSCGWPLENK